VATSSAGEPPASAASRGLAWLIAAVLRRRVAALIVLAAVVLVAALGLTRLRVDFSSTSFYGDGSAPARRLAEFQATWGADDHTLLILVHPRAGDDPDDLLTPERLAALAELSRALERDELVERVTSIATMRLPMPRLGVGPRAATTLPELLDGLDPPARAALLERLPLPVTLLGADRRATAILVELGFSSDDVMRTKAVVDELEPILAAHDPALAQLGLVRELAGVPAIRAGFFELVVRDQSRFIPLTLALIGLALLLVFRRLHAVLIPALAAAIPTLTLVGVMAWSREPIGLLNQAYFTLLPVILVADAIHMVARFHEERARAPKHQAIIIAGSRVGLACLLTSLTTAAGFASLLLTDMPILRSFGLYAALGVALGFVLVIVLVPLLLSFVADDRPAPELPGLRALDRAARLAIARPGLILLVTLALLGAAVVPARAVEIDNTLTGLLDDDHPTAIASRRVDAELGGVLGLEFELSGAGDLREPEALARVHEFERWLLAQVEVRSVEGPATILAGAGPLLGRPATIPSTRAEVDARLELIAEFVPLERTMVPDGSALRIHAGVPDLGGRAFIELADRSQRELDSRFAHAPIHPPIHAEITGTALLAYRGVNRITADLRAGFALVFLVVLAVIALVFRSPWPALVAVLPNGLPLALGYALIGLRGDVLDPLAAVILTLALAIAVDDTLHILVRTREELRRDASVDLALALRRAIEHSGRAVALTSVVIAGGLALNSMSSFPPLQMLGLLGAVVIVLALLANVLVLPASLMLVRARGLSLAPRGRAERCSAP
jgi:uncharacterized protein